MAVPSSGPINMAGIFSEKNEDDYSANNPEENNISLRGLSSNSHADSDGGNINLNDQGSPGPDGSAPHSMSEFYNYDQDFTFWNTNIGVGQAWGNFTGSSSGSAQAGCTIGFAFQPEDNRVRYRTSNFSNSVATSYAFTNITYNGSTDPDQCEFQITFSGSSTGTGSTSLPLITSGSFVQMAKQSSSSDTGSFTDNTWSVSKTSGFGTRSYNATSTGSPSWSVRAKNSSGTVIATSAATNGNSISLSATRGSGGFPGGPGGGFGGDICIHEDMLVNTALGPMHIKEVVDRDPKIWAYNWNKKQKELVDQVKTVLVEHDNLFIINNEFMITEDHIMYGENNETYSIIPELALKNYGKHSQELKVGNKLSTLSGDKYIVNTIERYDGIHLTYTISTQYNNFYANDILVDSEI